jgi:hypothetical protein
MQFDNQLVTDYLCTNRLKVIKSDASRPWGGWYLIDIHNPENSSQSLYDKKIIRVVPGTILSLQYHGSPDHMGHSELWEACTKMRALIGLRSVVGVSQDELEKSIRDTIIVDIEAGGKILIRAGCLHALANPYDEDVFIIEQRQSFHPESPESRENNIVRIYDQTNRNGVPSYPVDLLNNIMNKNYNPDVIVHSEEFLRNDVGNFEIHEIF